MRRLLVAGLVLPILLLTAACSGSGDSSQAPVVSLTAVKVSGPTTSAPHVTFKAPIAFGKTSSKVIDPGPGTGPAVTMTSLVTVQFVAINADDESVFGSSWKTGPKTFYVNSVVKGFAGGLLHTHAGDRVLIGVRARDAFGSTGNLSASVRPGNSVIFVVDVLKVFPQKALPANVPQLTYDSNGNPSKFTSDKLTAPAPTTVKVYPIVEGDGPVLKAGDQVKVDYFGQIYPDKTVFNAWNGEPFPFQLGAGQVIKGWEQGLVGQHVGSRVVLVIPPADGYGKKKQDGIPANSTLIFTVQILSASV